MRESEFQHDGGDGMDVGSITSNIEAPTKLCKYCREPMPLQAQICTGCSSWQNWRGMLNFSVPVLSLLLALATVVFSSGREFYQALTYRPNVYLLLTRMTVDNANDERWKPGDLDISIVNNENEDIVLEVAVECTANNSERPTEPLLFRATRFYSKPNEPIVDQRVLETGQFFFVKAKTQEKARFNSAYWQGELKTVIPSSTAPVNLSCSIPYFYKGERRLARVEGKPFIFVPPKRDFFDSP
jgi:hypothetical protein